MGKSETKLVFLEVRKAHLIPVYTEKVVVELPDGRVDEVKEVAPRNEVGRQQLGKVLRRGAFGEALPGRMFLPSCIPQQGDFREGSWRRFHVLGPSFRTGGTQELD